MRNVPPLTSDEELCAAEAIAVEVGMVVRESSQRIGGAG